MSISSGHASGQKWRGDSHRFRTFYAATNREKLSVAEFQSVYYQYWEYAEDAGAGTGEDTRTDPSVSG
jgi:hypothetical protein